MNREEIFDKVKKIFIDVFDDEDIEITYSTDSSDIEEWDSLKHVILVGVIEDEFNIKFAMESLTGMKNVSAMIDKIQELIK